MKTCLQESKINLNTERMTDSIFFKKFRRRYILRKCLIFAIICITIFCIYFCNSKVLLVYDEDPPQPLIIVITPTYRRLTRLADLIRMGNTLQHIRHLHWLVIEDGNQTSNLVNELLNRTGLPYTYLTGKTTDGYPARGWYQRSLALKYIRENSARILGNHNNGVVYFGDDDNSYDIRLFNDYIRNVKRLGMWAVGIVGDSPVESPKVENGKVIGYFAKFSPGRAFAVDMAGFALGLNVVLGTTTVFRKFCDLGAGAPETCFLLDLNFTKSDIEPFGYEKSTNRDVLVWHTKTVKPTFFALNEEKDMNGHNTEWIPEDDADGMTQKIREVVINGELIRMKYYVGPMHP